MKIWSRATHFDWSQPDSKNKIYQGHEDGIIREWTFDRQAKKLVPGYEKWKMLDAIRDITSIPKYDLLLASCRNGSTCIWNTKNHDFYYTLTHHTDAVSQISAHPDETTRLVATASWD